MTLIAYQTAILHGDGKKAATLLPEIPQNQLNRLGRFLETQGLKKEALEITNDPEHKFELSMALEKLDLAFQLALEFDDETKWILLGDLALSLWDYETALDSYRNGKDLESMFLIYQCSGNASGLQELSMMAIKADKINIALMCFWLLGQTDNCIDLLMATNRIIEAALLSRAYLPSKIDTVVEKWKESLHKAGKSKFADTLADSTHQHFFPDYHAALQVEGFLRYAELPSAKEYSTFKELEKIDFIKELKSGKNIQKMLSSQPKSGHSRAASVSRSHNSSTTQSNSIQGQSRSVSPINANSSTKTSPKSSMKEAAIPPLLNPRYFIGHEEIRDSSFTSDNMSMRSLEVNTTGTGSLRAQSEGFSDDPYSNSKVKLANLGPGRVF